MFESNFPMQKALVRLAKSDDRIECKVEVFSLQGA